MFERDEVVGAFCIEALCDVGLEDIAFFNVLDCSFNRLLLVSPREIGFPIQLYVACFC